MGPRKKNHIFGNKFAVSKGHSITAYLISMDNYFQEAFNNNQHITAVCTDIEITYDRV